MDYIPSNSSLSKNRTETPQKARTHDGVKRIVTGTQMKDVKQGVGRKLFDSIVHTQDVENIGEYLVTEIVGPSIAKTIMDAAWNILSRLFGNGKTPGTPAGYVSYRNAYSGGAPTTVLRNVDRPTTFSIFNPSDVLLESRGDGEEVLYRMAEVIGQYGSVNVADFCEFVGMTCDYTHNRYGWHELRCGSGPAFVERVGNGFVIRIDRPIVLE